MSASEALAAALALGSLAAALWTRRAMARIPRLTAPKLPLGPPGADSGPAEPLPTAAVVVAAKDEANTIEPALRALLTGLGPGIDVVLVDDRSTDGTDEILERLGSEFPQLKRARVDTLPAGWLGKNHALQRGAAVAGPVDYLVFSDADVVFEPGGVRAAVTLAHRRGLDHLGGAPRVLAASWPLAGMVATFGVLFALFTRPWRAADPKSRACVGIGALNVVRRSEYEAAGGHGPIAMRIDDDLRLAKLMKARRGRSAFAIATDICAVAWYPTLPAMLQGLHKNAFAGVNFRLSVVIAATFALVLGFLGPFVVPWLPACPPGAAPWLAAVAVILLASASDAAVHSGLPRRAGLFLPIGIALFLGVLWRSALGALLTRRVVWRGTAYPLRELLRARGGV